MAKVNLVIDIGSSFTTIYKEGEGIVLHEPTVVLVRGDEHSYRMVSFGLDAYRDLPKVTDGKILSPVQEGAITYKKATLSMLESFISKVVIRSYYFFKPKVRAFINIPCGSSEGERALFKSVLYAAGVDETYMLDAPQFASFGTGVRIGEKPRLFVDIGGGITDVALINSDGIQKGASYGVGVMAIDGGIVEGLESSLGVKIGHMAAEELKKEIGSLFENENLSKTVIGKNVVSGTTKNVNVTTKHVRTMIDYYYDKIASVIKSFMKELPDETLIAVAEEGIIVTGGGAAMKGLDEYLMKKLKAIVMIPEKPEFCTIKGGANLLADPKTINHLLKIS